MPDTESPLLAALRGELADALAGPDWSSTLDLALGRITKDIMRAVQMSGGHPSVILLLGIPDKDYSSGHLIYAPRTENGVNPMLQAEEILLDTFHGVVQARVKLEASRGQEETPAGQEGPPTGQEGLPAAGPD